MDDVLSFVAQTYTQDAYGVRRPAETEREVFCQIESVTRSEFFGGGRSGLNPEQKFIVFAADYQGESIVEYGGSRYAVYRTYHIPGSDYLEIYTERKGGTLNASSNSSPGNGVGSD